MVGRNPHFESKTLYLKSVKGIGEGSQRYVIACFRKACNCLVSLAGITFSGLLYFHQAGRPYGHS